MLALRRSFCGTEWETKFFDIKSNKFLPTNSFVGLLSLEFTLSTLRIGGSRNVCREPRSYLQTSTCTSTKNVSPHQELTTNSHGPSHLTSLGVNFLRRCLSTAGHPVDSVDQVNPSAPGDSLLPERIKVKRLDKTAKHIMNILDKEALDKAKSERNIPDIESGYIVEIKVEAPENKGRISTVKGLVIAKRNSGIATTIRIRRLESGVGTESVFPVYSPNVKQIKVLEKRCVRRAKLYYVRDRPYNLALKELAQRTAKKKREMILRAKRAEKLNKK